MTHTHEWLFDIYEKNEKTVCRFVCRHDFCDEVLEGPEVLKRLNGTERLNAAQASAAAASIEAEDFPANELRAYAAVLETT